WGSARGRFSMGPSFVVILHFYFCVDMLAAHPPIHFDPIEALQPPQCGEFTRAPLDSGCETMQERRLSRRGFAWVPSGAGGRRRRLEREPRFDRAGAPTRAPNQTKAGSPLESGTSRRRAMEVIGAGNEIRPGWRPSSRPQPNK